MRRDARARPGSLGHCAVRDALHAVSMKSIIFKYDTHHFWYKIHRFGHILGHFASILGHFGSILGHFGSILGLLQMNRGAVLMQARPAVHAK